MEPKLFQGYLEWGIARSLNILFMNLITTYIKCVLIEPVQLHIALIIHLVCNTPMEDTL
jgi:hypothetical protein